MRAFLDLSRHRKGRGYLNPGPDHSTSMDAFDGRRLVEHARRLQHIGPLATRTAMAVLEVLAEVIGSEELLGLVAFVELVDVMEVFGADDPLRGVGEFVATVPAHVAAVTVGDSVEGSVETGKCCAGPGVAP